MAKENENKKYYPPDARILAGVSLQRAECYGKPGIGARYHYRSGDKSVIGTEEKTGVECAICGKMGTNIHHFPPKGYSRVFPLNTIKGTFILNPALFLLCGSGTIGCHGAWHNGLISAEWIWDDAECAEMWWDGTLIYYLGAYSPQLYKFGCWELKTKDGEMTYREYNPCHDFERPRIHLGVI